MKAKYTKKQIPILKFQILKLNWLHLNHNLKKYFSYFFKNE
ncbi:hypothetical protein FLJC2902T_01420 [Flavobacterium limnosediminis JC2902]|uniref:Uncharacterized protein n=1 Tax=Flavobacterium limnosediminis JC2902 TaxID=1341181 RepID=V6STA3_9FLAO|nr:hypothetical protein FLJC2902T_01420 [Flavobacterium limnosediminis JC2902]